MNLYGNINSILEEKRDINDDLVMTKKIIFTDSGMVESISYFYSKNQFFYKSINYYEFGDRLTKQDFIMDDSLMLSQEYVQINQYKDSLLVNNSDGGLINIGIIEYNNEKQVLETKLYDLEKELISLESSKYDDRNRLIETRTKSFGNTSDEEIFTYIYDSMGRIQTYSVKNSTENFEYTENYNYDTDEMNNWVEKQTISSDGEIIAIVKRKIEYK